MISVSWFRIPKERPKYIRNHCFLQGHYFQVHRGENKVLRTERRSINICLPYRCCLLQLA
uniref:Uncharacterized protein n=1 Tax=Rhizophora mucronata TaxID=61149 RepID=A0A2P2PBA6_RHIMU